MSIRRSLAWAFSGQFTAFIIHFTGLIIISRLLSPREIGIYAIAMAALGIAQVFTTFGVASYIIREQELTPGTLESAFTVNAVLVAGLSVVLVGVSFAAGPLLDAPEAGSVLRIIAISNLLAIINFRPSVMLQREMQFKQLSFIGVVNTLVQTVATISFALAGASYMSAAYGVLCAALAGTALTAALGRHHISFGLSRAHWRPITTFGFQMMSVSGVATMTGKMSDLLLGRILGVTALGLYGRASSLNDMIFNNLYGTATRVVFVQLSKDYRERGDWRGTYLRSFAMITAFMWPVLLGLAILARPVIMLLYGERWLPAALPLSALMVAQFIGVAFGMNWELFVLRGETGRQARYEVTRLVLGIPIFAVGCLFGIVAAGMSKIFDALIGLFVYYPHVNRLAYLKGGEIPQIYWTSAVLTLVAVVPSAGVMTIYGWSPHTPLALITGAVLLGIAFWLIAIFAMRHPLRDEMVLLARRLRPAL